MSTANPPSSPGFFQKIDQISEELKGLQQQFAQSAQSFEEEKEKRAAEQVSLYQQVSELRGEVRREKEQRRQTEVDRDSYRDETGLLKEHVEKLKGSFQAIERENKEYKKFLAEREQEGAKLHTLKLKYQNEIEFYEKQIGDLQNRLLEMSQQGGGEEIQRWLGVVRECVIKGRRLLQKQNLTLPQDDKFCESLREELETQLRTLLTVIDTAVNSESESRQVQALNQEVNPRPLIPQGGGGVS